ncbi:MAG: hypothetical protein Kow0042_01150 [Calditrichia bacterium]
MKANLNQINDFLNLKRFTMVGVSRQKDDFTRRLFREFLSRSYEVLPVNPHMESIDGKKCYSGLEKIPGDVQAAMILVSPEDTPSVVRQAIKANIKHIWIVNSRAARALEKDIRTLSKETGTSFICGECPFMFLPDSGFIHQFHGWIRKVFRDYPH